MARKEKYIKVKKGEKATYFTVQFDYTDIRGKKKSYSKTFTSTNYASEGACLDAAVTHRDLKRAELIQGTLTGKTNKTVGDLLEDYYRIKRVPMSTQKLLSFNYDKYISEPYGSRTIDTITSLDVTECLESIKFDASKNVIIKCASIWHKIFKTAMLEGIIFSSPMEMVETPRSKKSVKPREQTVNEEDLNALINYLNTTGKNEKEIYNNHIIAFALQIMYYTGMRPQEVFALSRKCVDLKKRIIEICASIGSTDTEEVSVITTKNDYSIRSIEMSTSCEMVLRSAMAFSRNEYFLFNYSNKPFKTTKVSSHITTICRRLKISIHMYALRHNFATTMITANVDPRTVMELMGHKSVDTTLKYPRSNEDLKQSAVSLVENSRKQVPYSHNKAMN